MQSQSDLPKVVLALDAAGGFSHLLNRRQQHTGQHQHNGDDHQDFDQGQAGPAFVG
jgi:hypothetical protein